MIFSGFHTKKPMSNLPERITWGRKCNRMLAVFFALFLISSSLSGCAASQNNTFPKVTQPKSTGTVVPTENTAGTSDISCTPSAKNVLKVAAPFSSTTAQYLARLYTAKKTGTWTQGETGSSVPLSVLDAVVPLFNVEILQTPSTGATEDTIKQWKEQGVVPDILYTNAMSAMAYNHDILPITSYTASNSLFLPTRIYMSMLSACSIDNTLYGIPYSSSAQILFEIGRAHV